MDERKGLHDGHRERIIERFIKNPDGFADHELLEILLFQYIPRKNTNDIAHRLLLTFGGLDNILSADVGSLITVEGIGKKTAVGLKLLGEIVKRIKNLEDWESVDFTSPYLSRRPIINLFKGLKTEKTVIILLDKHDRPLFNLISDSDSAHEVSINKVALANAIALNKPKTAILAHNHPSGNPKPSAVDDMATVAVYRLCALLGVELIDHVIVAKDKAYSYRFENKFDKLLETYKNTNF